MITLVTTENIMLQIAQDKLAQQANLLYITGYVPIPCTAFIRGHFITKIILKSPYNLFEPPQGLEVELEDVEIHDNLTIPTRNDDPLYATQEANEISDEIFRNIQYTSNSEEINFHVVQDGRNMGPKAPNLSANTEFSQNGNIPNKQISLSPRQTASFKIQDSNRSMTGTKSVRSTATTTQEENDKEENMENNDNATETLPDKINKSHKLSVRPLPPLQAAPRQKQSQSPKETHPTEEGWQSVSYRKSNKKSTSGKNLSQSRKSPKNIPCTTNSIEEEVMEMDLLSTLLEDSDTNMSAKEDANKKKLKTK